MEQRFFLGVRRNGDIKRKKNSCKFSPHKRLLNEFNCLRVIFQDLINTALLLKYSNQKQKQERSKTKLGNSDALSREDQELAEEENIYKNPGIF